DGRRRFVDRMAMSFEPGHAEAVLSYDKAMRERNRLLKDQVNDAAWYGALEAQMAGAGAAMMKNRAHAIRRVSDAQTDAQTAFPTAGLALSGPEGVAMPATAPDIRRSLNDGRARDMAAGRALVGPHRADLEAIYVAKGVAARQCSTGEQKALLISLILANGRALSEDFGAPPILLLDEVAAHLDRDRRAALYEEVIALGAQAFMTGTGAELFDDLRGRAQMLEITELDGISNITERSGR
ncbi:MAG: DNA replication and repair protein RecF, partial [Paracoccaceae bacterium]